MSRLAIVVANLFTMVGNAERTAAHLIAVNEDTGKGVMLNLDAGMQYVWEPLPDIPLHLLDAEKIERIPGSIAEDQCPFRLGGSHKGEARCLLRNNHDGAHLWPSAALQDDGITPLHDVRDLDSDIAEDRH